MTTTTELYPRNLQLWPGGKSVTVRGEVAGGGLEIKDGGEWRPATADELRAIDIEERAEMYANRDIHGCDSALVDDLLKASMSGAISRRESKDLAEAFDYSEVKNLRPDPSDWDLEQCKDWLEDHGVDLPDPNPWAMDRQALIEAALSDVTPDDEEADTLAKSHEADLLRAVIDGIDDETIDGIDKWREAVNDNAEDAEVYEWWRVSSWLCKELESIGECVLDNGYGYWWGRTCTGQGYIMDGVLQRIAAKF